jgi:hypothetical protein
MLAMATWRLRRLYHVEAGFYTYKMKCLADIDKHLNLGDTGRVARAAEWGGKTLDIFGRQEGRFERSFYRALHELQRLRKERESNLASVLQPTPDDTNKEVSADPPTAPSVSEGAEPQPTPSGQHPSPPADR